MNGRQERPPTGRADRDAAAVADARGGKRVKKYASSVDVARVAGVSQSAVSRTFSGGSNVSEGTRKKVLEAAEAARLPAEPHPAHHADPQVEPRRDRRRRPLQSVLFGRARSSSPSSSRLPAIRCCWCMSPSDHALDDVIPKLASYRVDAIVSALAILSPARCGDACQAEDPCHLLQHRREERMGHARCPCDNFEAGRTIADLFVARGARSFGFISGPVDEPCQRRTPGRLSGAAARNGRRTVHCRPRRLSLRGWFCRGARACSAARQARGAVLRQ